MIHEIYLNDIPGVSVGAWLERAPDIPIAPERGTWQTMPGHDGEIFQSDGALSSINIDLSLHVENEYDREQVIDWIMSAERVRVSPWGWEWRVNRQASAPKITEFMGIPGEGMDITVTLKCAPYRYVWPYEADVVWTANGTKTISNDYNVDCLPVITAVRTSTTAATSTIKIGTSTITIAWPVNVKKIVIDCEKKTAVDAAGANVASAITIADTDAAKIRRWPALGRGDNTVIVNVGSISSVTIEKRCRRR